MMRKFALVAASATAMLALSACSNTYADVVRFHSNQPISRGTLALASADPAVADSLEFRTHAETVAIQLRRLGYSTGLPADQVQFVATIDVTQADSQGNITRPGLTPGATASPVAANVAVPAGGGRRGNQLVRGTTLSVQIRPASGGSNIWEGRATKEAAAGEAGANPATAVPLLAEALFRDFPGTTGVATRVRID
jgi:hypothetical protein